MNGNLITAGAINLLSNSQSHTPSYQKPFRAVNLNRRQILEPADNYPVGVCPVGGEA